MTAFGERMRAMDPRLRQGLLFLLAAGACYGATEISDWWTPVGRGDPILWLPAGIGYGSVLVGGPRYAGAAALAALAEQLVEGDSARSALLLALGAALSALSALIARRAGMRRAEDARAVVVRSGVSALGALAGSAAALAGSVPLHGPSVGGYYGHTFLAQVAGMIVVAPLIRSWTSPRTSPRRRLELLLVLGSTAAIGEAVASGAISRGGPAAYLIFPPLLWAALRTGRRGVSAALLLASVIAATNVTYGNGPFADVGVDAGVALDAFLIVTAFTSLLLVGAEHSRRVSQERLHAGERRLRTLLERLPLVTYVNGPTEDDPPRYVSPQIEAMLGYPVSDWYGDPRFSYRVIHADDLPELERLFVADGEDSRRGEYRMIAADGRVVWVLDHMVALHDDDGSPAGMQGFLVDVTERKRLEEQLAGARRMEALGVLVGGIAHDFNNLLTAISGYGELARTHLGDPDVAERDLEEVLQAAGRASGLTRQLLVFGRRALLAQEPVDLTGLVVETRPLVERQLGPGVTLDWRLDPGAGTVRADRAQLAQALLNLAANAGDALGGHGRVTITTAAERVLEAGGEVPAGDYAVLSVADDGPGVDPAVRERLFEPFFTTKRVGEGPGLGLAVVYGVVEQSGGFVVVRSEAGAGAEFRLLLPLAEAGIRPMRDEEGAPRRGGETVLLVDDEEIVRRLTCEMLQREGYRVLATASPAEALRVDEPYDLLLTDVVMPDMTGPELAERIAASRPGVAVLFASGYSRLPGPEHERLADGLLEKPFTLEQLARKVREALDSR